MGKLYITEFYGSDEGSAVANSYTDQTPVTYSTSTQSAAFGSLAKLVRIHTDSICSIRFGANPSATTNDMRLAANQTEYFAVTPGHKVAAITNT